MHEQNKNLMGKCPNCGIESHKDPDSKHGLCMGCEFIAPSPIKKLLTIKDYEKIEFENPRTFISRNDKVETYRHCHNTEARNLGKLELEKIRIKSDKAFMDYMPKEIIEKVVEHHGGKIVGNQEK